MNLDSPLDEQKEANCDLHGQYLSMRRTLAVLRGREFWGSWSLCTTCVAEHEEAERSRAAAEAERREHRRREALLTEASLPPRFAEVKFEMFQANTPSQRNAQKACTDFAASVQKDSGGGLLLIGQPGTGKTMLSAAMVRSVIVDRGLSARFIRARDLVFELRAAWRSEAELSEDQAVEGLARVGLLVIDDIGVGFGSEAEQTQLLDVIDRRYQRRRPTVCTSNLDFPRLADAIGERVLDRLKEDASIVLFQWPSHRRVRTKIGDLGVAA